MINFIQTHPLLVFSIAIIIAFMLIFAIIKVSSPSKKKNNSNLTEQKFEKKVSEKVVEKKEEKTEKKKDKKEKEKKEKKVETVYKSEKKEEDPEKKKEREEKDEKELLGKMAFVKTSKTISKLAKREWIEKVPESEFTTEELIAIDNLIRERELEDESKKSVHFDKSIRLSDVTKSGDYYAMFGSHISDPRAHLSSRKLPRIDKYLMDKLYARTYKTLEMSGHGSKDDISLEDEFAEPVLDPIAEGAADKREEFAYMIDSSYNDASNQDPQKIDYLDDTLNFNSENMLVVDTVMHRKNKNKPPRR